MAGWLYNTFKAGDPVRKVASAGWHNYAANYLNNIQGINGIVFVQPDANGYGAAISFDGSTAYVDTALYDTSAGDQLAYVDLSDSATGARFHVQGTTDTAARDTTYDLPVKADFSDTSLGIQYFVDAPVITDTCTHYLGRTAAGAIGWRAATICT